MPKTEVRLLRKIPASESGPLLTCRTISGDEYIISQNPERKKFTMWHKGDTGFVKCGVADFPFDLEAKIPWDK